MTHRNKVTEGVIRYDFHYSPGPPLPAELLEEINYYRRLFYQMGLIGVGPDGIGYGNLSQRLGCTYQFVITGTQTGHLPELIPQHYTLVTEYNLDHHILFCQGPIPASSEALSHAALYACSPQIKCVLHMHQKLLWEKCLFRLPTTNPNVGYGTSGMVREIIRLFRESNLVDDKCLVMAGHQDGLICFGSNMAEIYRRVQALLKY